MTFIPSVLSKTDPNNSTNNITGAFTGTYTNTTGYSTIQIYISGIDDSIPSGLVITFSND